MFAILTGRRCPGVTWPMFAFVLVALAGTTLAAGHFPTDADQPEPTAEPRAGRNAPRDFGGPPDGRRPNRPGRRGGPPPGLWKRLSEAERTQVREFVEEHFPRMYEELERLKERHPDRYNQRMRRVVPELIHLMEVMEFDPERGAIMIQERRLDIRMRYVARRYRFAKDEETRTKLTDQMHELCAESFDLRQQRQALEIRQLETRITELKDRHEEATRMRDKLIDREVKERLSGMPPRGPGGPDEPPPPEGP